MKKGKLKDWINAFGESVYFDLANWIIVLIIIPRLLRLSPNFINFESQTLKIHPVKSFVSIVFYFIHCFFIFSISLYINTFSTFAQTIESKFKHPVYEVPDIFVITNRVQDSSHAQFSFTNQVNKNAALTFFRVNVSSKDSIQLSGLDSSAFFGEISEIKNQDWLLFVHGDSKTFEEAVIRGLTIQNTHHIRVIVFAWPSKDSQLHGLKNLKTSYLNVEKSVNHFNAVLQTMAAWRNSTTGLLPKKHLSLFLHSLGNNYLEELVKSKLPAQPTFQLFDNVIMNAPAVESKNHSQWVEQLQFQKNILININRRDFKLWALRFFTKYGKQLGQTVQPPFANNAHYFDFTKMVGCQLNPLPMHTYFIGKIVKRKEKLRVIYYEMFHGNRPEFSDKRRFNKRHPTP